MSDATIIADITKLFRKLNEHPYTGEWVVTMHPTTYEMLGKRLRRAYRELKRRPYKLKLKVNV